MPATAMPYDWGVMTDEADCVRKGRETPHTYVYNIDSGETVARFALAIDASGERAHRVCCELNGGNR
jgi:hypothetical protein